MIKLPKLYNYCGIFLTYKCNLACPWCINRSTGIPTCMNELSAKDWIAGLNAIDTGGIPLTFGGGEPTLHPNFYEIVNKVKQPMDLLTNGEFDYQKFMRNVKPNKFKRDAPYASIRFSYHPGITDLKKLLDKVDLMQRKGYSVGIWAVNHPAHMKDVMFAKTWAEMFEPKIDFRLKEFLGVWLANRYGTYMYPEMLLPKKKDYLCKPTELLISPSGNMYRCHQNLYNDVNSYGNIVSFNGQVPQDFLRCNVREGCSPCDLKGPKLDRFQKPGHCAVEIKSI